MNIKPGELIADLPAVKVRDFLRRARRADWGTSFATSVLQLPVADVTRVITALEKLGYIARTEPFNTPGEWWRLTGEGRRFASASAMARIRRKKADQQVADLLDRVRTVNRMPYYLFRVARVRAFGSFIRSEPTLSDIDLVIDLVPKEPDPDRHDQLVTERCRVAAESGRAFSNLVQESEWARIEVEQFLRNRSRYLSFHAARDLREGDEFKVIFDSARDGAVTTPAESST